MKFLYKINSAYDGFSPARIAERLENGKLLRLGWDRYIDVLERGTEVWVYFRGPHKFKDGVYVKGYVRHIETSGTRPSVLLRVRQFSGEAPLTDDDTSQRVAEVVSPWYRQVFVLPEDWTRVAACSINSTAASCKDRRCEDCEIWKTLPLINSEEFTMPERLVQTKIVFFPAYWVIPSRCYLTRISRHFRNTSEIFYRFKIGEKALSFPLALAIFKKAFA